MQLSECLIGAGGFISKVVHSYAWQVSAGCWQVALVLHHVDLSIGLLECPHDMGAVFPQSELRKGKLNTTKSYDLTSKVTLISTISCPLHMSVLFNVGGNYTMIGGKYQWELYTKP